MEGRDAIDKKSGRREVGQPQCHGSHPPASAHFGSRRRSNEPQASTSLTPCLLLTLLNLLIIPTAMSEYERNRQEKIKRNKALIQQLGLPSAAKTSRHDASKPPPPKRRKLLDGSQPADSRRVSARIAAAATARSLYDDFQGDSRSATGATVSQRSRVKRRSAPKPESAQRQAALSPGLSADVDELKARWATWTVQGPAPTRDDLTGFLHFEDWPSFTPNKTPAEMLHEGVFGGSYFRPLYSKRLKILVEDDWQELPVDWIKGLKADLYLFSPNYNPEVNKYKVACGQSIETWEENGWIDTRHDIRGWFQWYCRFYQGRRCDDDDRQVGRWSRCVGEKGRWRRALLKKYGALGIRSVMPDMDDEDDDEKPDVSPTVHQTCLQWAFEVRQSILDEYWTNP